MKRMLLALLLALPASLHAQYIDVNQPLHQSAPKQETWVNLLLPGTQSLQTFIPHAADIVGAGFFWHQSTLSQAGVRALPGVVQISLFAGTPTSPGSPLASANVAFDIALSQGAWIDAFWSPVQVTPGAAYVLGIRAIDAFVEYPDGYFIGAPPGPTPFPAYGAGPGFASGFNGQTAYADGALYVNGSLVDAFYGDFYDLTFRTWTTAPEPSTWAMLAVGLLAISAVAARRSRRPA